MCKVSNYNHEVKLVESALAYARLNLFVLPLFAPTNAGACSCASPECKHIGKHPRISGGVHNASIDEEVIRAWWEKWPDANIGIATGVKSKIVVFDFDFPKGGESALRDLIRKNTAPYKTPRVKTGNGIHLYFQYPGFPVKSKVGILPGVDVRGDGGYAVAPPSLHETGRRYEWKIKIGGEK